MPATPAHRKTDSSKSRLGRQTLKSKSDLIHQMLEVLGRPVVLALLSALLGFLVHQLLSGPPTAKLKLPIVGAKKGDWFPFPQAQWRNTLNTKYALLLADTKYRDQPVLFPTFGASNLVLLPRSHAQFIVDQPDSILDTKIQTDESIQTKYTIVTPSLVHDPANVKLISVTLTSQIGNLVSDLADEIYESSGTTGAIQESTANFVCLRLCAKSSAVPLIESSSASPHVGTRSSWR